MKRLITASEVSSFKQVSSDLDANYNLIYTLPQEEGPLIGDSWIFGLKDDPFSNLYRLIMQVDGYECRMILQVCQFALDGGNELGTGDPVDYRDDIVYFKDYLTVLNNWIEESEAEDPNFTQYE